MVPAGFQHSSSKMGKSKYWRSKLVGKSVQNLHFLTEGLNAGYKREQAYIFTYIYEHTDLLQLYKSNNIYLL